VRLKFCLARPDPAAPGGFRKACELYGDVEGLDKSLYPAMYRVTVARQVGAAAGWRYVGRASNLDVVRVADGPTPDTVYLTCARPATSPSA
jgi:hypothetical protein